MKWKCPYCHHMQTIISLKRSSGWLDLDVNSKKHANAAVRATAIGCSNPDCDEIVIVAQIGRVKHEAFVDDTFVAIEKFKLRPQSAAIPQPDYIPQSIRDDYYEACKIKDLSPKASATLSRRCIQGMIRDFCSVSKPSLYKEIETLRKLADSGDLPRGVSEEGIDAIDAVRTVGNIGAHMESDVNVVIDVEPEEAATLIELIELLFEEWYIAREARTQRLNKVLAVSEKKKLAKKQIERADEPLSIAPPVSTEDE